MKKIINVAIIIVAILQSTICFAIMPTKDLEFVGNLESPVVRNYIAMKSIDFGYLSDDRPVMTFDAYSHSLTTNLMVIRKYQILPMNQQYRVIKFKSINIDDGHIGENIVMYDNDFNEMGRYTIPNTYLNYIINNYERYKLQGLKTD